MCVPHVFTVCERQPLTAKLIDNVGVTLDAKAAATKISSDVYVFASIGGGYCKMAAVDRTGKLIANKYTASNLCSSITASVFNRANPGGFLGVYPVSHVVLGCSELYLPTSLPARAFP